tara:strand:+ start:181 stop:408 length:228 start_codon:yes stop_codon:yes gene_type:complete
MKTLAQVTILMFITLILSNCSNGWSVGNLQLTPEDTSFMLVVDQDSTVHHYQNPAYLGKDSWCIDHNQFEIVRKK